MHPPLFMSGLGFFLNPFYTRKQTTRLCVHFISCLPISSTYPHSSANLNIKLSYFIVYVHLRMKLHSFIMFTTFMLKVHFPTTWGSLGCCLVISTFMLTPKMICDNIDSNKSWSIVAKACSNCEKSTMCQYLKWELNINPIMLREFEEMICKDFIGLGVETGASLWSYPLIFTSSICFAFSNILSQAFSSLTGHSCRRPAL